MERFIPKRAFFEPRALDYPIGEKIYKELLSLHIPIQMTSSHNRVSALTGLTSRQAYREAKQTLVVGVKKTTTFAPCKPSAHYQLPLNTSCPGMCEYCYLATTLGKKPYVRLYVNIEEILNKTAAYIEKAAPKVTIFEGAATSDPIPTEYLSGLLKTTIEFFGRNPLGRFRFVTKHTDIESLLTAEHSKHTTFRFSLNCEHIIAAYEHHTAPMLERIQAASQVAAAGYPLGFIIAPVFSFPGWQAEYQKLFATLSQNLPASAQSQLTFEFITHRFTLRAKNNILSLFPETTLPMETENRQFKYGQFGYGKYIYDKQMMSEIKEFLYEQTVSFFPAAKIDYFV
ncbi:MAG: spore photoproduct lyase [Pelosinus sp.]|nr:spore photoproduct lyase [Pelosinus sp.]